MRKIRKILFTFLLLSFVFTLGTAISQKNQLQESVIRLHVVADSDSVQDQQIKLQVRDALTSKLESVMERMPDLETAKTYLQEQLPELERIANDVLVRAGNSCRAVVSLAQEAFSTRAYDTFSLPAGVYESLRVTIGSGEGRNWWCVVFPTLCVSATADGFEDTAAGAGFSDQLTDTLTGKPQYRVRFFILDCLGRMENWFYSK